MEDNDMCDESDFILDNYEHSNSRLFYTVTRLFGEKYSESLVEYFQNGCDCGESGCTTESGCACLKYGTNYRLVDDGAFVLNENKFGNSPVFECNFRCSCFARLEPLKGNCDHRSSFFRLSCGNRCVQFGPIDDLKVFDAGKKGLGLKTEKRIRNGSFICEYAGEVIELKEAIRRQDEQMMRGDSNYVFILREYSGNILRSVTCVDPSLVGNVGRYINHSCRPNAAIVPVRVNNSVPWLCVFAIRNIEPEEEICFDYSGGGNGEEERFSSGNRKHCLCDAKQCRSFLPFAEVRIID